MASCANCHKDFCKKPDNKGFYRFSLENPVRFGNQSARDLLTNITGSSFTPVSSKRSGQFVCPECWGKLNETARYQNSLSEFWGMTHSDSYLSQKRRSESSRKSPMKKARMTSTPCQKRGVKNLFSKKATKTTKWDSIISNIKARQYGRAIKGLYNATKGSKSQFIRVVIGIVRREMGSLLREASFLLFQEVNILNLEQFSWSKALNDFGNSCPLLFNVLKGAVTSKSNEESLVRGKYVNLKPQIGTIMASILHTKAPKKASFLPTLMSIQFWRGGLKREVLKQLARIGMCKGYDTTLAALDKIRKGFDSAAIICKQKMEHQLSTADLMMRPAEIENELPIALAATVPNVDEEINEPSSSENTISYNQQAHDDTIPYGMDTDDDNDFEAETAASVSSEDDAASRSSDSDDEPISIHDVTDEEIAEPLLEDQPGFTLCWDNVGKKVTSRHPTETNKNKYLNMALGYVAINRCPTSHLQWWVDGNLTKAVNLPSQVYIPSPNDFEMLENRMKVIVGRILTRHLPWFKTNFADCVTSHILHEFSSKSTQRSVLINLGVFDVDPSSTQGAIEIYENLQRYIPSIDNKPHTAIVYGDGLSCERGNDAHRGRANGLNAWERLEGCEPGIQEFHKEMLLLQDYFDEFFKGSSSVDRGTLCQIKNIFNYRQVKSDISDNFNHAWELMCLTTEGYVCLLATKLLSMNERGERPINAPADIETSSSDVRNAYLQSVITDIVKDVWHQLDVDPLKTDDETAPEILCCGEEIDEDFILCSAGRKCIRCEVFHYTCAGLDADNLPNTWFCSDFCRNERNSYPYCNCHQNLGDEESMIGCSAGAKCTGNEWYHLKCLKMKNIPKGDWFCKTACKTAKKTKSTKRSVTKIIQANKPDCVLNYSRGIVWVGLNLMCRRDAVREADGEAMMSHWKLDLVHFFSTKHPKYVILAHRLLVSINGWLPEKLRSDLIYNRTVNYGGGLGRNLPMDFMNEILNRLFKDLLDSAKGRYTDSTLQRCSQLVGPLGEALDSVFDSQIIENELYRHRRRDVNRDVNVEKLILYMKDESLFTEIPGREHRAFPDFTHNENPKFPGKYLTKMQQLSKRLDKRRRIILDE